MATNTNLNNAFSELRKRGYTAKQDFWCCQSCAWAALSEKEAEKAVFYHKQDTQDLKERNFCHLSWSGDAKEIIEVLNSFGINTEWEGLDSKRILITLN